MDTYANRIWCSDAYLQAFILTSNILRYSHKYHHMLIIIKSLNSLGLDRALVSLARFISLKIQPNPPNSDMTFMDY